MLLGVLVAVRVVGVVALLAGDIGEPDAVLTGDARRYHAIASADGRPYRDFAVEFPPLSLAAIEVVGPASVDVTTARLAVLTLVADLATAGALLYGWGRRAALAYLLLGLVFVVYPFLFTRLDLLSVALAAWGLALARREREALGGAVLAAACFAKLWPVVLVPILVAAGRRRAAAVACGVGAAGVAAWVAWAGTDGLHQVLTMRDAGGWQIESIVGSLIHALPGPRPYGESGAWRIAAVPPGVPILLIGVTAVLVGWVAVLVARARAAGTAGPTLVDGIAPLAAVAALLVCSPLLSPQFACWLLPFAAVAMAGEAVRQVALAVWVMALSTFAVWALRPYRRGELLPVAVVLGRNALLVVLLVSCLAALGAAATAAPARLGLHRAGA